MSSVILSHQPPPKRWLLGAAAIMMAIACSRQATAQTIAPCQPPNADEYLLLVVNENADTPARVRQNLPANANTVTCNYLGRSVTRISGFTSADIANAWAQYFADLGGLQAFVARPPNTSPPQPSPALPPTTATPPAGGTPTAFNPQPLNAGYAVLVDYANRPDIAASVQQAVGRPIGIVSFEQRPYVLAVYTADLTIAATTLRSLSQRNFSTFIVDSSKTILISPSIAVP